MKKFKTLSKMMLSLMFFGLALASCSSSESIKDKLQNYVPDDANLVIVGDLQKVLEVTGTKANDKGQLELSDDLSSLINSTASKRDRKNLEAVLDFEGIDYSNVVFAMKMSKSELKYGELIFSIVDEKTFANSLDDYNFDSDEEEGFKTFTKDGASIVVKDKTAFMVFKQDGPLKASKAISELEKIQEDVKEASLASWKVDYLTQDCVARVLMNGKMFLDAMESAVRYDNSMASAIEAMKESGVGKAIYGMGFNIKDTTVSLDCKVFDTEGKDFKIEGLGTIDKSLVKYAGSKDIAAMAGAIDVNSKAFTNMIDNLSQLARTGNNSGPLKSIVDSFGGQFFIAGGPNSFSMSDLNGSYNNWHFVVAISAKAGKGAEIYNFFKETCAQEGSEVEELGSNSMKIRVPVGGHYEQPSDDDFGDYDYYYGGRYVTDYGDLFIKLDGNNLVFSNSAIATSDAGKFDKSIFNGNFALSIIVDKSDLKEYNIPFGVSLNAKTNGAEGDLAVSLTGAEGSLVDVILSAVTKNMPSGGSSDYDDYD